jgi:hypothetical protein
MIKIKFVFLNCFIKMYLYSYTITVEHLKQTWKVHKNMKEFRDVHKALARLIKSELGIRCSDIPK